MFKNSQLLKVGKYNKTTTQMQENVKAANN